MPIEDLKKRIDRELTSADVPMATQIVHNLPVYDCSTLTGALSDESQRAALKAEARRQCRGQRRRVLHPDPG